MDQNNIGGLGMEPAKKSYGALIAVIVILVLMIIGGLYFLGQRMDNRTLQSKSGAGNADEVTQSLENQSDSDDVSSIEADLEATNIDNVDQGSAAIESEMNAE